jgi:hypothetical protein
MRARTGLVRFVLEGVFLVVVAALLAVLALNWLAIVLILAGALLLAIAFDRYAAGREQRGEPPLRPRPAGPEPALAAGPTHVHALGADEAPAAAEREPMPEPEEERDQEPVGEAPLSRGRLGRRARSDRPTEPAQAAADQAVLPAASEYADEPREWNIWQLDRRARDGSGVDAARDEERALLLMHLRGFAGPDGLLPASFDDLVRESFGELVAVGSG